jgi:hypothetical protein
MNQKLSFDVLITELAATDPIDEQILTDRIGPVAGDVIAEITAGSAEAPAGTRPRSRWACRRAWHLCVDGRGP